VGVEQDGVLEFDLVADVGVAEIDERPVEDGAHLDEHMLLAPGRGDRESRHIVGGVGAEPLDVAADRCRLGRRSANTSRSAVSAISAT
jgi:hypothetical protein